MKKLYVVGTPIGNMQDVSSNVINTLNNVDIIACEDTRVSINLLRQLNIKTKLVAYHKFNEKEKSVNLINELLNGKDIALISDAGCPCISDPGSILVNEAIKNNIEVYAISGPSAVIVALMSSGFEIPSFSFYGFLPRENKKMVETIDLIKKDSSKIAVIYESPKRIKKTLEVLKDNMDDPEICVCNDLTKKFERKYYGTITSVLDELNNNPNSELGEYVIVINKKDFSEKKVNISNEALLLDYLIKENITLKDAIKRVSEDYKINKNIVYDASLNLKKIMRDFK